MRTVERLTKLQEWMYETLCKGRMMKTPAKGMNVKVIKRQEPKVFLAFFPMRPDTTQYADEDPANVAPSILIMPAQSYVANMEDERFDRYKGVSRPAEMGEQFSVQVLFSVFEDGLRLPGFIDKAENGETDFSLVKEGTEDGLFTLLNWMDDLKLALLTQKTIPGTDLIFAEKTATYGMYADQKFVSDKRPLFYGYMTLTFNCHVDRGQNNAINDLLL